jgi:hypothetical protein
LAIINFTSSFRAKKFILTMCSNIQATALQYLYDIYTRKDFKPFMK